MPEKKTIIASERVMEEWNMEKGYDGHTCERVGRWFEEHREEMIRDIIRLVRIPSISDPLSETGPFGKACRLVLDEMLAIGLEEYHRPVEPSGCGAVGRRMGIRAFSAGGKGRLSHWQRGAG